MNDPESLRVVAWNCAGGLIGKTDALNDLSPDIAVLSETTERCKQFVATATTALWTGQKTKRDVTVLGFNGWAIHPLPIEMSERRFVPLVATRGRSQLHLVATCVKKEDGYVPPTLRALGQLQSFISDKRAMLVGDFNQTRALDCNRSPKHWFGRVVEATGRMKLVSVWHTKRGEAFGKESRATYYHQWSRDKSFHIDYIFCPSELPILEANVGSFERYVETRLSDHVPLSATFSIG